MTETHPANQERAARAGPALSLYCEVSDTDTAAQDLMCDLLHNLLDSGWTQEQVERAHASALTNFRCEVEPDDIEEDLRATNERAAQS